MNPTLHLSDEQIYDLLQSSANPATQPHLQNCPDCRAELANLRESLANFRDASTRLAAVAAPTRPPVLARAASWFFGAKIWAASFATAAAVLAISLSVLHPVHTSTVTGTASGSPSQTAFPSESDDALLDGIQKDLSTSIPPSLQPLAVPAASSDSSTQN